MRSARRLDALLISRAVATDRSPQEAAMFDVLYLVLTAALFAFSIAMIRFFDRL
jgi:hypothetical protein